MWVLFIILRITDRMIGDGLQLIIYGTIFSLQAQILGILALRQEEPTNFLNRKKIL